MAYAQSGYGINKSHKRKLNKKKIKEMDAGCVSQSYQTNTSSLEHPILS
jgi:hypothetical protein